MERKITMRIKNLDAIYRDTFVSKGMMNLRYIFDELNLDYSKFINVMRGGGYLSDKFNSDYILVCDHEFSMNFDIVSHTVTAKVELNEAMFSDKAFGRFTSRKDIFLDAQAYRKENKEEENMDKPVPTNKDLMYRNIIRGYPWIRMCPAQNVPEIIKVEFFDEGPATIKVTFGDGTHTTATCSNNDVFDFDIGLGICIAKRALGTKFNRLIEKAHKLYIRQEDAKFKKSQEEMQAAIRADKKLEKKRMKAEKREAEWRQEQIDILAEAIKKAREDTGSEEVTHKDVFKIAASMIKKADDRKERNKKILELRSQGKSYNDIAKELGVSKTTIGSVIRESNKH